MQPKNMKNVSFACAEAIEKPVCRDCIEDEIEEWLKRRNARLLTGLRRKTKEFFAEIPDAEDGVCIICKNPINGCPHCYINYIQDWIGKKSPDLVPSFKLFFNF
ncbi:MAG: hypothetical protein ABIB47_00635 [Candidatus Woesearchaeota archaeon]